MRIQRCFLTFTFLLSYQIAFCQNKFRVDYDIFATYEYGKWSEWQKATNTFVFNSNENADIIHYSANGTKQTFRKVSQKEEGYTDGGKYYQVITVLDEEGNECLLQYFEDTSIGVKLIFSSDLMLQVAKSN